MLTAAATGPALPAAARQQGMSGDGVLIIYLTRTHNTEAIARMIADRTGGTQAELRTATPYPTDYQAHVDQVVRENETGFLAPLADMVEVTSFRTVFIGFPTWGMQLPPPVKSFLHQTDLRNKTVLPFNTHAEFGVGTGFAQIRALCSDSDLRPGLSIKGGYEKHGLMLAIQGRKSLLADRQVADWLKRERVVP